MAIVSVEADEAGKGLESRRLGSGGAGSRIALQAQVVKGLNFYSGRDHQSPEE